MAGMAGSEQFYCGDVCPDWTLSYSGIVFCECSGLCLRLFPLEAKRGADRIKYGREIIAIPALFSLFDYSEQKNSPIPARNLFIATSEQEIRLKSARNPVVVNLLVPQYKFLLQVLN